MKRPVVWAALAFIALHVVFALLAVWVGDGGAKPGAPRGHQHPGHR